jgi:hypothetical protein
MLRRTTLLVDTLHFKLQQRRITDMVPHEPHFDPEFTEWFRHALEASRQYVEYGSGGSTLLADRLNVPTISVESDSLFGARVRANLSSHSTVRLLTPNIGLTGPWGRPMFTRPNRARIARWARYVEAPMRLDGSRSPDLCLVDGRFRRACALAAASWAQRTKAAITICIDDYFIERRESYTEIEPTLGRPQRVGRAAVFKVRPGDQAMVDQALIQKAIEDPL